MNLGLLEHNQYRFAEEKIKQAHFSYSECGYSTSCFKVEFAAPEKDSLLLLLQPIVKMSPCPETSAESYRKDQCECKSLVHIKLHWLCLGDFSVLLK